MTETIQKLDENQVKALSVGVLAPSLITKLNEAQLHSLTEEQLKALNDKQVLALFNNTYDQPLTRAQIQFLPTSVFGNLTKQEFATIRPQEALRKEQVQALGKGPVRALTFKTFDTFIPYFTPAQVKWFRNDHCERLTPEQITRFDENTFLQLVSSKREYFSEAVLDAAFIRLNQFALVKEDEEDINSIEKHLLDVVQRELLDRRQETLTHGGWRFPLWYTESTFSR